VNNFSYPKLDDLLKLLRFSAESGQIWLGENRVMLMHAASLASIRKRLMAVLDEKSFQSFMTQIGFEAGIRDAEVASRLRGSRSAIEMFAAGPQLVMLEGSARVTPLHLEIDPRTGHFYGEFSAEHIWEADTHLREHGHSDTPVCWMQTGYASGFTSTFMGRSIVFHETSCAACGSKTCILVGKPAEEWSDENPVEQFRTTQQQRLAIAENTKRSALQQQDRAFNPDLIGQSLAFTDAYTLARQAANTDVTVLLLGETGVGKGILADAIHQMSNRKLGPFVPVNCAAIPHDLLESELFGAERGAYTGATASRAGKFERAHGGTIFLDEIGDLPLSAQVKLLRVLQEGEVERLGDDSVRKVDIRVIAATNVDLKAAVQKGLFRADLYFRLCVFPVNVPALRQRASDIPLLVNAIISKINRRHKRNITGISERSMQALLKHDWPGNIRELENVIERSMVLTPENKMIEHAFLMIENTSMVDELEVSNTGKVENKDKNQLLIEQLVNTGLTFEQLENMILQQAVDEADGVYALAARNLGMTSPQLRYRLKKKSLRKSD